MTAKEELNKVKKEELSQYIYAQKRVDEAIEECQKYFERATKMSATLSNMPKGKNKDIQDEMAENTTIMADLEIQYKKRWNDAELERLKLLNRLDTVKKEPHRTLLYDRYVKGLEWEEVAEDLKYSCDRVKHIHGEALDLYEVSTN